MNPVSRLARRVGIQNVRRTFIAATLAFLVAASGLTILTVEPLSPERSGGLRTAAFIVQVAGDSDGDGLPDAVENLIGSDPGRFDALGGGVADGYVHHHFASEVDWTDSILLERPVLRPPTQELPEPLRRPGAITFPTVAELYHYDTSRHEAKGILGAWWLQGGSIDPHVWDNAGDGIADAWLLQHGLDPLDVDPDGPAPGDEAMTLREKYLQGLDPTTRDTDGDGLLDVEELAGRARIADLERQFEPTDPLRPSTRSDGIADGFLVRFGLDPHDPDIGAQSPAGDGLTVAEAFLFTQEHCHDAHQGVCPWRQRLEAGPLLDPTQWDSNGDGVPDIWALRDPHGVAHPFDDMRSLIIASTEAWDAQPWSGDPTKMFGVVIDAANPAPETPFKVSVADAYAYLRPQTWDEGEDGPWWNGLPTVFDDSPAGALPLAVALRGWNLTIDRGLGGVPDLQVVRAHSDPRRADSDGDGLLDIHEHFGVTAEGVAGPRTNPADPDTDSDGLADALELELGTNPLKRDTSGSFLSDGFEYEYWTQRLTAATTRFQQAPAAAREEYAWLNQGGVPNPGGDPMLRLDRLGPLGDLDADGVPNILAADADGDGLRNGEELFPNQFFGSSGQVRPATDPARLDTDGEGLPDGWEVAWSQDRYFNCGAECRSPVSGATGWPLDPSKLKSIDVPGRDSDFAINLAADTISLPGGGLREFTSGLAYIYDLHPYRSDTSGDGLSDMFTIHHGVENVPAAVVAQLQAGTAPEWVETATARVNERLEQVGRPSVAVAVLDPAQVHDGAPGRDGDLLSRFDGREKGTWLYSDVPCPTPLGSNHVAVLSATGLRREAYGSTPWSGAENIPDRVGLTAGPGCWQWQPHTLGVDQELGTDPWRHASSVAAAAQVPDAWRHAYSIPAAADPGSPALGSVAAGCDDESRHDGLPDPAEVARKVAKGTYCLTLLEAYLFGLNPNSQDTDGGGMPDWLEVALGLDPLNPNDDDPDGDWDGDGLTNLEEILLGTNPLTPDSDRDGLADGGTLPCHAPSATVACPGFGQPRPHPHYRAGGDLCLHKSGGQDVAGTAKRPGGPLTSTQMFARYVAAGILHVEGAGNGCPTGMVRFLSESRLDPATTEVLGAGIGSDPTRMDTSGDGLPDGWVVYWRIHGDSDHRSRFDPTFAIASEDADDGVGTFAVFSNLEEYQVGRPADWDDPRDGPWWGGTDPTRRDTTGTRDWFNPPSQGEDLQDPDADADGLIGPADPFPLEHGNQGQVVHWSDEEERYVANYTKLWNAISQPVRTTNQFIDSGGDGVPDWLDRARVQILDLVVAGTMVKGAGTATVTGRVVVAEPFAGGLEDRAPGATTVDNGAGVVGATVRLIATDAAGNTALVGAGFTETDGLFTITAAADTTVAASVVPHDGSVLGGQVWEAGDQPVLATRIGGGPNGLGLQPGPIQIRAIVDPNDPALQDLSFGGPEPVRAYKPVSQGNPYPLPDGRTLRALVYHEVDDKLVPDANRGVTHATRAIFSNTSAPVSTGLAATTQVILDNVPGRVVQGLDSLAIGGRFVDVEGVGLGGRPVHVTVPGVSMDPLQVSSDGTFSFTLNPLLFPVGDLEIQIEGKLLDSDQFLAPANATAIVPIARETHWAEVALDGKPLAGTRPQVQPGVAFTVTATLTDDHKGISVPGRPVQVHLLRGLEATPVWTGAATTDNTGRLNVQVAAIGISDDPTLHHIRLREVPEGQSSHRETTFTIEPRYPTTFELGGVRVPVGQVGFLEGRLTASQGPVSLSDAPFLLTSQDGKTLTHTGTDAQGNVRIPVSSDEPFLRNWTVSFGGTTLYAPSAPIQADAAHHISTRIQVEAPPALRSHDVPVSGRLLDGLDRPLAALDLEIGWDDGESSIVKSNDDGRFEARLPPRTALGGADLRVRFNGTDLFDPSAATARVAIHLPTRLSLDADDEMLAPGDANKTVAQAVLADERGEKLPGRILHLEAVAFPLDCTNPASGLCPPISQFSVEWSTGADGAVSWTANDLPVRRPANLLLAASYHGTANEAPAQNSTNLTVTHRIQVQVDRLSERVRQGEAVLLEGRLEGAVPDLEYGPVLFEVRIPGQPPHPVTIHDPANFRIEYPIPQGTALGEQNVSLSANGTDGYQISSWQGTLVIVKGVDVQVHETLGEDGRKVRVKVIGADSEGGQMEGELVLLRRDPATQRVLDIHRIDLDPQTGEAELDLGNRYDGELSVVALRSPTLEATETVYTLETSLQEVRTTNTPSWILPVAAAVAGTLALVAAGLYLLWRASGRRRLQRAFADAHKALWDPSLTPAEVVRRAYQQLLAILDSSGYTPPPEQTVRDIADSTIRAFQVKPQPMREVSKLFELVVYSKQEIPEAGRREALRAFLQLARDLGTPERSLRGGAA